MAEKKTFVSYDHSEDVEYKRLLQAWDANTSFNFDFDSRGPNVPIDSYDASVIKGVLTTKMKEADYLLVIIGEKTHTSKSAKYYCQRDNDQIVSPKLENFYELA